MPGRELLLLGVEAPRLQHPRAACVDCDALEVGLDAAGGRAHLGRDLHLQPARLASAWSLQMLGRAAEALALRLRIG